MRVVKAVDMTFVTLLILATALSGCTGGPGATTLSSPRVAPSPTAAQPAAATQTTESPRPTSPPAASQTRAAAPTTPAEAAPSGCADLELPALVVVPPPGRGAGP